MRRGRLHTTTVRFHADTWAAVVAESHRLGIAHAEFIRCAVLHYLGHTLATSRIGALEGRVEQVARDVGRMAHLLRGFSGATAPVDRQR